LFVVWNQRQLVAFLGSPPAARGFPPHHSEEAFCLLLILGIQSRHPALEVIFSHILRVEVCAEWLARGHSRNKRLVLVDIGPWPLANPEIMQASLAQRRPVPFQLLVKIKIPTPVLLHEHIVEDSRC